MALSRQNASTPELETVTHWPTVAAGAFLGLLLLAIPCLLVLVAPKRPAMIRQSATLTKTPSAPVPAGAIEEATEMTPAIPPLVRPSQAPSPVTNLPPLQEVPDQPVVVSLAPAPAPAFWLAVREVPPPETAVSQEPKRLHALAEYQLVTLLREVVPELDLDKEKDTSAKLRSQAKAAHDKAASKSGPSGEPLAEVVARRSDLKGLPVRMGAECQAPEATAKSMQRLSRELRGVQARKPSSPPLGGSHSGSHSLELVGDNNLLNYLKRDKSSLGPREVSTLVQMLQIAGQEVRLQLVQFLSQIKGPEASAALAQRALFDLAPEVREAAVWALNERPPEEWRPILLRGFHYPWSVVAEHAAEALVTLDDRDAVLDLARQLDLPDPAAPTQKSDGKWVAPELVRVNHLRNCMLCHAPSFDVKDSVRGLIPEPGQPLRLEYYESNRGDFVRADITYLRQDFSVMQPVAEPNKWPEVQRYDYLVRLRELTEAEQAARAKAFAERHSYPQRDAVLFALRELTGQDVGDDAQAWQDLAGSLTPSEPLPHGRGSGKP
jgi:hypothetical protein